MTVYEFWAITLAFFLIGVFLGGTWIRSRRVERKLDLILRKLNNQQPDNEGGY